MIRQPGRHRRGLGLPTLDRSPLRQCIELEQEQAQARVGQHEIMVPMEERQLLTQPGFVFAQRVDPSPDRRYMLTKIQIERSANAVLIFHPRLARMDSMIAIGPKMTETITKWGLLRSA